ncbi:MAG TPA: TonB-dependent receptor [Lentimicrobium sp.]|nr:TonB-dependent receptor [Lentimicrobium sp.]
MLGKLIPDFRKLMTLTALLLPILLSAQINIKGRVIDVNTVKGLPGAHVSLNNNFKATITRPDGMFEIKGIKAGTYHLKVTYMGYADWEGNFEVTESRSMLISMEPHALNLKEDVIISATRAGDRTPVASATLSRENLKNTDISKDMPLLLDRLPATVSTSDAGSGIGYTSFRIRGTDMNRINITVNGIPLNDAESHGVFFVNMPDFASSLSSVQVQRGVGTSTNGAAAFGASVNLQTTAPSTNAGAEISSSAGSFNTFRNSASAWTGLMDNKWSVEARLSKISSDGYIDRASSDLKSFYLSSGYYGNKTILKFNVFSGAEKTYQAWDGVPSYMLDTNRTYNGIGMYYDCFGNQHFYDNETDNYQQDHYQAMIAHSINNKANLNFALHYTRGRGYYEQYKDDADLSDYGLEPLVFTSDTIETTDLIRQKHLDNHFYGYTLAFNYNPVNRLQLTLGSSGNIYDGDHFGKIIWAEYAATAGSDFEWYRGNGTKKELNLFLKGNYRTTGRVSIYGDLQLRNINYDITGTDDDLRNITQEHDFLFFNPKAGFFYELHSNGSLYASVSVAHREPNRDNFTDADPTKPEPLAERLYDYEVGYHLVKKVFTLNTNLYYMHYNDQLILTGEINDVGQAVMTNVEKSYRIGVEVRGNVRLTEQLILNCNAAFSRNRIKGFIEKVDNWDTGDQVINDLGNTDLAFSPELVAGMEINWSPADKFTASLSSKYVSKQYIDNTSSEDRSLDPYFVSNLKAEYMIVPGFLRGLNLSLSVNNLFNAEYEANAWVYKFYYEGSYYKYDGYFPQAGTNFMAGVTVKL